MLRIYNTLTRKQEALRPIEPGHIRIYVCGMTVYDYCHLGHARVLVAFDVVVRYLRSLGYRVTYVRNITDIDDKIIARANENGEDFRELTRRFTEFMHEDCRALGTLPPDIEPKATQYIDRIIEMVERLVEKGIAYQGSNGDVYYDVSAFPDYGNLSHRRLEDMRSGARVEVDEAKDDPLDFVLWKSAKPGEPSWDSPWGSGRPGWHIECSAMSTACLGEHFDIHGGGMDLQFPHHENEIAQSEGATGCKFVNVWMHNGFVRIDDEKMSKSLGNFFTTRSVLERYPAEAVRCLMLLSHYRSPLNYSTEQLDRAMAALTRLYTALRGIEDRGGDDRDVEDRDVEDQDVEDRKDIDDAAMPRKASDADIASWKERFHEAMDDDFNTPQALSVLFELAREINRLKEAQPSVARAYGRTLRGLAETLGLLGADPESWLRGDCPDIDEAEIAELIDQRAAARARKDFAEADRLRERIESAGFSIEDGAQKTTWRRARRDID